MNYEFVSTNLSLAVLKNLMPLLKTFEGTDKLNLVYSISNILKGEKENKIFFYESEGSTLFLKIILESTDEKLLEMCTSSLKELASYKKSILGVISKD